MVIGRPWTIDKSKNNVLKAAFHLKLVDFGLLLQGLTQKLCFSW